MAAFNVLFTSVGRRVELMRAFKAAYGTLGLEGNIVAVDTDPLAPALWRADRPYIVPKIASPDYLPALLRIIEREQVNAIFPLIDPEIPVLARHREAIEAAGARLAVVSSQAAVLCSDKWLQTAFFRQLNLPVPQTWLPGTIDAAEARYPLFIKPRNVLTNPSIIPNWLCSSLCTYLIVM